MRGSAVPVPGLPQELRGLLATVGKNVKGVQTMEILSAAHPVGATGATLYCRDALRLDTSGNYLWFRLTLPPPRVERTGYRPRCSVAFTPAAVGDYYVVVLGTASTEVLDFYVHRVRLPDEPLMSVPPTKATRSEVAGGPPLADVAGGPPLAERRFRYAHVVGPASDKRDRVIVEMSASPDPPPGGSRIRDRHWYLLSVDILRVMR